MNILLGLLVLLILFIYGRWIMSMLDRFIGGGNKKTKGKHGADLFQRTLLTSILGRINHP